MDGPRNSTGVEPECSDLIGHPPWVGRGGRPRGYGNWVWRLPGVFATLARAHARFTLHREEPENGEMERVLQHATPYRCHYSRADYAADPLTPLRATAADLGTSAVWDM